MEDGVHLLWTELKGFQTCLKARRMISMHGHTSLNILYIEKVKIKQTNKQTSKTPQNQTTQIKPMKKTQSKLNGIAVINCLSIYIFKRLCLSTLTDTFDNKIDECVYFFYWSEVIVLHETFTTTGRTVFCSNVCSK